MPSCSNSSNISSSLNALSVIQGGSRLEAQIPFVSGLTTGNVIRYDVLTAGYTASKANGASESEVFGVIESFDSTSNKFIVVVYGSINISPSNLINIDGTGGCGGNDIYFLSGLTAGKLQNLAPDNLNHIIKPIYQVAPHGTNNSYTGVVVNYLGYRAGGELEAIFEDQELGNIQIVVGNNLFGNGYVDASKSHRLSITEYSEFYAKYGTQYGYVEKIQLDIFPISANIMVGNVVRQSGTNYRGTIVQLDQLNGILYVARPANALLAQPNSTVQITLTNNSVLSYKVSQSSIHEVYTPIITLTNPLDISGSNNLDVRTTTYIGIKVKPQGIAVSIPNKITSLKTTNLFYGTGETDLETTLNNFEQRIQNIEQKLNL